jgi:hypothetical protein
MSPTPMKPGPLFSLVAILVLSLLAGCSTPGEPNAWVRKTAATAHKVVKVREVVEPEGKYARYQLLAESRPFESRTGGLFDQLAKAPRRKNVPPIGHGTQIYFLDAAGTPLGCLEFLADGRTLHFREEPEAQVIGNEIRVPRTDRGEHQVAINDPDLFDLAVRQVIGVKDL